MLVGQDGVGVDPSTPGGDVTVHTHRVPWAGHEMLAAKAETYLKTIIGEVTGLSASTWEPSAPFGELGIDSFHVLKIVRRLETEFGSLPKTLLFERFTLRDLAEYFVRSHEDVLKDRVTTAYQQTDKTRRRHDNVETGNDRQVNSPKKHRQTVTEPIRVLEAKAFQDPELRAIVEPLFERYKVEGSVSLGTRRIAPNLFIGSARRGYLNYGRAKAIIVVYSYTGPREYVATLLEEMYRYCEEHRFQLNILADEEISVVGATSFSATPFGVLQRLPSLRSFSLRGGDMRRLRYLVTKFERCDGSRTQEYRCGSDPETDKNICQIIEQWCEGKTMVNPLVHDVKHAILAGTLPSDHRVFLTYASGRLQNVILVTRMSADTNGYLMDLEFYPPDMPLGGLEYGIVQIIEVLRDEGCEVLSLGGTYGCKLGPSSNADTELDSLLDQFRQRGIFDDSGNLQFKNKFRPVNRPIYLCRPKGSGDTHNVIDVIMMIADPDRTHTSDEGNHNFREVESGTQSNREVWKTGQESRTSVSGPPDSRDRNLRLQRLVEAGFNPLNIPAGGVEFDLKTDSWAQLEMTSIDVQQRRLREQLQEPVDADEIVKTLFPFAHYILTASGREAEHILFKAWPKKGVILQNLLFHTTIFHELDKGFVVKELPAGTAFDLSSDEAYKGNLDFDLLKEEVERTPSAISCVVVELGNNATGGHPVSLRQLRDMKSLLNNNAIALVMDVTRVLENAQRLIELDRQCAGKTLWMVVKEILSYADTIVGSLTKDFCVKRGGIIATRDLDLFKKLQQVVFEEGVGIDLIDSKIITLSLRNQPQIEDSVLRRMEGVRRLWHALNQAGVPVVQPAGAHCVLVNVKQLVMFQAMKHPVPSFLAWIYQNTGIRASAHSVGMQKNTPLNELVRIAVPIGVSDGDIEEIRSRLLNAFTRMEDIPEIALSPDTRPGWGAIDSKYELVVYHNPCKAAPSGVNATVRTDEDQASVSQPARGPSQSTNGRVQQGSYKDPTASHTTPVETDTDGECWSKVVQQASDIAIIGMAGRYPESRNLTALWRNLVQGRDCITEIPVDRYERRLRYGPTKKYRGGFLDAVDKFDSLFFNIPPRMAELLDPQERLFLEVAWEAIEDAGYRPDALAAESEEGNVGVFVGAVWTMYQMLGVEERHRGAKVVPNSFLWSIANRVSYYLDLSGPSLTVDTACSSGLTALYLACESLRANDCGVALVGGVNLDLHEAKFNINASGGALSPDGVCRSFGKGANGYVAGEGVGALVLKPLERAVRNGDHIYGVIKGVAANHGGRTSGYTVPSPTAQSKLILKALEKANVGAHTIGYVETHGTGTELGDPIEIAGLTQAFATEGVTKQGCAIGSIKSNIGHLEAAAGIVSISKVLLQMAHRKLVPSLHANELSEFIDFASSPFYVVQSLEEWQAKQVEGQTIPRRAGVSSFGAGGSNVHVILEEYQSAHAIRNGPVALNPMIFPFSARSELQVRELASQFASFIEENIVDLADAAYTLQLGRKSFEHRLAVVARTKDELIEKIRRFVSGGECVDVVSGNAGTAGSIDRLLSQSEKTQFISLVSQNEDPRRLARMWVEGILPDWQGIRLDGSQRRISLPTYPFADKRHWISEEVLPSDAALAGKRLHPLVDSNESTLDRSLFRKSFDGSDFVIRDHVVANTPTLPGAAYLELIRKVGELAGGRRVHKIKDVVWVSPFTVHSNPREIFIEVKPANTTIRCEIYSKDQSGTPILHCQSGLSYEDESRMNAAEYIDLDAIRSRCAKVIGGSEAYPTFDSIGVKFGPSFQVLREVYKNEDEVLAAVVIPSFREQELGSMSLHPSIVDGCLQAGVAAHFQATGAEVLIPYSIMELEMISPLEARCFSYVRQHKDSERTTGHTATTIKSDVLIVNERGKILVKINGSTGVSLRELDKATPEDAQLAGFSKLYYCCEWIPAPLRDSTLRSSRPSLLFVKDDVQLGLWRQAHAWSESDQIIEVFPGDAFREVGRQAYVLNPERAADFTELLESLKQREYPIENICYAWAADSTDLHDDGRVKESLHDGVFPFLLLCQSLIRAMSEKKVSVLFVYSTGEGEIQPLNDAMRGFIKTLRLEHRDFICKTIELQREKDPGRASLPDLRAEYEADTKEDDIVRYAGSERYIRKLKAFDLEQNREGPSSQAMDIRKDGVYLITGGGGRLAKIVGEFLAEKYKCTVILTSRSGGSAELEVEPGPGKDAAGQLCHIAADISKYEDVKKMTDEVRTRFGAIHGIIHAAGSLRDSLIRNKTPEELSVVFAPKIQGTLHLDIATKSDKLDFFVAFSSLAAVAGNVGQADYSFANSFMDSFTAYRERLRSEGFRSGKSLSINWGLWAEGGMRLDEASERYFSRTLGMKPLTSKLGLETLLKGLASEKCQFAALEGDQRKVEAAWGLTKKPVAVGADSTTGRDLASLAAVDACGDLLAWCRAELSGLVTVLLKIEPGDISVDCTLLELGFDSIGLAKFANAINERFKLDLSPVLFFDYPSISELAKYLSGERQSELRLLYVQPGGVVRAADTGEEVQPIQTIKGSMLKAQSGLRESGCKPIAIIGMSGRFRQSESLDALWCNLANGESLSDSNRGSGGFRQGDPEFFGISSEGASTRDPRQGLILEECWRALENAGYTGDHIRERQCGIYIGCEGADRTVAHDLAAAGIDAEPTSSIPATIAYHLDLHGPAIAIDTGCSSSLVAVHLACQSLWSHESEMAIAGGVSLQVDGAHHGAPYTSGAEAEAGRFLVGEGAGVVVLKRLNDALEDGDHIHGVIVGSGLNQDGSSHQLVGARARAQEQLLTAVYNRFALEPDSIRLVEANCAGTRLEDSIECKALMRTLQKYTDRKGYCKIGTVKTTVGATGAVSGLASLLKVLLCLQHRQIPPCTYFEKDDSVVQGDSGPLALNREMTKWTVTQGKSRKAAINSFGAHGTNAHLVVEEAPLTERTTVQSAAYLIPVSARTSAQLNEQVENLITHLRCNPSVSVNDLSFTLFMGRAHFKHRICCIVRSQEELISVLDQWNRTGTANQVVESDHQETHHKESLTLKRYGEHCIQECNRCSSTASTLEYLEAVADLYVRGYALAFPKLFPPGSRRIPLPTYPFSRGPLRTATMLDGGEAPRSGPLSVPGREASLPSDNPVPQLRLDLLYESVLWGDDSVAENYEQLPL
jgi:polyketide synthase PksN